MSPDQLLEHFDRISEAPSGIRRFRNFIFDLAMKGKLVPQDENDESAQVLLNQIEAEIQRRIKEGSLRKARQSSSIANDEMTINLPDSWQLVKMGQVVKLWNGFAFKSSDFQTDGVPIVRIGDLCGGIVDITNAVRVSEEVAKTVAPDFLIPENALLIAMSGATTGKVAFNRTSGPLFLNQRVGRLEPILLDADFVRFFFETIVARNLAISFGTAIPNLSAEQINETPMPLPPLAEQKRIVAKVDELMGLCDRLEAAQQEREALRDKASAASLARLSEPAEDSPTFREHAQFHLTHLPRFTTRPDQIASLRQTILSLAVRGKLVPQCDNDEPVVAVNELLRSQLIDLANSIGVRNKLPTTLVYEGNDLPTGWGIAAINCIGITQTGTTPSKSEEGNAGKFIPFIKPGDIQGDQVNYLNEGLSEAGLQAGRLIPRNSILMVAIGGSIGKCVLVDRDVSCNQQINTVSIASCLSSRYVLFVFRSKRFQCEVLDRAAQGTLPIISKGKWETISVPLPPVAEQMRIVAKVDELMALCDQLETSLATQQTENARLLEAILHEALAPT